MTIEPVLTSRRGFSKWLAGVGVAIAAPVAAVSVAAPQAVETADWSGLEERYQSMINAIWASSSNLRMRERAFADWKRRNPREVLLRSYRDDAEREADAEARARRARYEDRWHTTHNSMNFGRLRERHTELITEWHLIEAEIAGTPVKTNADLRAKARIARLNPSGAVQASLSQVYA